MQAGISSYPLLSLAGMQSKVMISAGELSGEQYGAALARALYETMPDAMLVGMGGEAMRAENVELIVDSGSHGSVMGFLEAIPSLFKVRTAFRSMVEALEVREPQLLILIDYPEFNLRLARAAKKRGVKVLYYITPKLWVWRAGRIHWFKRYIDRAAVIFPFEPEWFSRHDWPRAEFVGHPLIDAIPATRLLAPERAEYLRSLGLNPELPILAVFPGSRPQEVERHMSVVNEALRMLNTRNDKIQAVVCRAASIEAASLMTARKIPGVHVVDTDPISLMRSADAGLLKSGTTNLQAALCGLPFSMFYRTSNISAWIVRHFVSVKEYSIVNLISPGSVREILQEDATPEALCDEAQRLLTDQPYRAKIAQNFNGLRERLSLSTELADQQRCTVPERVARIAATMIA